MGLAMFGDKLPAEQAAEWGLIWKCVDDAELSASVDAMLQPTGAARPTRGLAATKQAIYAAAGNALEAQLDLERDLQRELGTSADYREGVAAFPRSARRTSRENDGGRRRQHRIIDHSGAARGEDAQALAERVAAAMYARDRASQAMGMQIAQRRRRVAPSLTMTVRADMLNGHATCHGGFIFTLADSAFAFACNSYNLTTVASGCTIEFVAPAREDDVLTAVAPRAQRRAVAPASTISR